MLATSVMSNEESFYRTSFGSLQNVQPNSYFSLATGMEAIVPNDSGISSDSYPETALPFLEIIVQPSDRFRFRYKSESGSHGKLRGAAKSRAKTNFPTVKLHNNDFRGKIEIKASLVTNEENPRPHKLELVGKNCSEGTCFETLSDNNTAVFRFLEIESKKKDELINILLQNKKDLYEEGYDEEEIKKEALSESKALNMNAARLCFEAFSGDIRVCEEVYSSPVINMKSASSDLKITRLSLAAGRCSGGEDMILLCDKINKDDIKIRFYEKDDILWEDQGVFNKCDVHHQVAIAFKTPKYHQNTEKTIFIELYRPSDNQSGDALKFTYIPDEIDALRFSKKRKLAPTESAPHIPDLMEASSSSSQFMSSPSNVSSGTEEEVPFQIFQGIPGTSSSNELTLAQILAEDLQLDSDPFSLYQDPDVQSFIETFHLDDRNSFDIQSAADDTVFEAENESNPYCEMECVTVQQNSLKSGLFTQFSHFGGSVVSYLQKSFSTPKDVVGQMAPVGSACTSKYIGKTEIGVKRVLKLPHRHYQCNDGTEPPSNIDYKKSAIPRPHENKAEHVETDNTTIKKNIDLHERLDLSFQGDLSDKNLETNKNFEHFKKGISDILRNRKKDAFLKYIAKFMNVEDENGNILLHLAVLEQSENINLIAKILEIAPQNVNRQNNFKETCLHFATMKDNTKLLIYLMYKYKGNPTIKNHDGNNCYHLAAKSNFVNSMKILLLPSLKYGKRIPSFDDLNYDGLSPLHLSIMNNAKECMQLLLQAGANVNLAERKTGLSPLHLALDQHPSLVGPLLCHPNIDTDCKDFRGFTAYKAACEARGSAYVQKEMLKVAQLNKNNEGSTIISFLRTENRKVQESAAEVDAYESSSSETSSDSECEDIHNLPTTGINHQSELENIQNQNINCMQENLNNFDEEKLCKILDANSDRWRKLGKFIGFDESTLNGLEVLSKGSSPAKIILRKVKTLYGFDETTLKNVLQSAELQETVHLLEHLTI